MRIIAGEWKGAKIFAGNFPDLRPLTDRIKESLFGILGDEVVTATVLDLYAGVGSFGLEALSRGAEKAVFVEHARPVAALLRKNLEKLRCPPTRYRILVKDVWKALHLLAAEGFQYDIVFADPPFREKVGLRLLQVLARTPLLRRGGLFVLRHQSEEQVAERFSPFHLWRQKKYGDSVVKFYRSLANDDNSHLSRNL